MVTDTPIKISAITKPNAWVVISGENEDYVIKTNDSGSFEQEVELSAGVNQILIAAFDEEGNSKKESLTTHKCLEFIHSQRFSNLQYISKQDKLQTQDQNLNSQKLDSIFTDKRNINREIENQLYQEAVSQHFEDLSIILDKLMKGIILEDFERDLLADYAFILKKPPQKSLEYLNKAKLELDRITKIN